MNRVPDVRVGIVTYGTPDDLERCLESLQPALGRLHAEVVVVDNGSDDERDAAVARSFPVRLLRVSPNVGYPRAMNLALSGTTAPVLVALNPDTVLSAGTLEELVDHLLSDERIGLVGPRIENTDGSTQHSLKSFPSPAVALTTGFVPKRLRSYLPGSLYWLDDREAPRVPTDVDWLVGAVHVVRRGAVGRDRVYSERAFMYSEDMELCWHLGTRGWTVRFYPGTTMQHVGNVTGERNFGGTRELRWLDATYDWYVASRGASAARRWAAANVAGLALKRAVLAVSGSPEHRRMVGTLLRFHAQRLRRPAGDQHSRRRMDGTFPEDPVVTFDSGAP